jgi:hypothetical protein
MTESRVWKPYRCRFYGMMLPAWLPVLQKPDGAVLLGQLSRQHPTELGPFLEQMHTPEDLAPVVAQADERLEDHQPEDDERRST